jgi:hypothetical protein
MLPSTHDGLLHPVFQLKFYHLYVPKYALLFLLFFIAKLLFAVSLVAGLC